MLLTPFSFIWVFQILIEYPNLLRNAYLCTVLFFNWVFSYMLKLSRIIQIVLPNGSYFHARFQECLFSLKIEDTLLNPSLTHL